MEREIGDSSAKACYQMGIKERSPVALVVGNGLGIHDLSFVAVVNYGFDFLSKDHMFQARIKNMACQGVLGRAQKVGKQKGKAGVMP